MINKIKKEQFIRDVIVLANAIELTKQATSKVSPAVCSSSNREDYAFNANLINWETFSNFSKSIKGE
mgnify:CR=1 FL=1